MPGAGKLDRRITIKREGETGRNEYNEPIIGWSVLATVWAQRKDASDSTRLEYQAAGQVGSSQVSRFIVRSSVTTRSVTPVDQISYDGSDWNILSIKETSEGRKRFIEITAARRQD